MKASELKISAKEFLEHYKPTFELIYQLDGTFFDREAMQRYENEFLNQCFHNPAFQKLEDEVTHELQEPCAFNTARKCTAFLFTYAAFVEPELLEKLRGLR